MNIDEILEKHKNWLNDEDGGERANLRYATGNRREIKSLFVCDVYSITYTAEYLQIGCEKHKINEWLDFDDARIHKMDGDKAIEFWAENKDFIFTAIEKYPANKTGKEEG